MGFGVIATVAGFNSNSYVTVAEADLYFNLRYGSSSWRELPDADKEAVLVQAARDIDIANYVGNLYYDPQTMSFPRDDHDTVEGNCASPTNRRFKHSDLKSDTYGEIPTNYWKHGSIHFTSATLDGQSYAIASSDTSGFVYSSFSATPTTTTEFIIFAPIHQDIKEAQCEQSNHILNNNLEQYAEMRALGIQNITIGDVSITPHGRLESTGNTPILSLKAKKLMSKYFRRSSKIGRA